jgi:hypothetical protein
VAAVPSGLSLTPLTIIIIIIIEIRIANAGMHVVELCTAEVRRHAGQKYMFTVTVHYPLHRIALHVRNFIA